MNHIWDLYPFTPSPAFRILTSGSSIRHQASELHKVITLHLLIKGVNYIAQRTKMYFNFSSI